MFFIICMYSEHQEEQEVLQKYNTWYCRNFYRHRKQFPYFEVSILRKWQRNSKISPSLEKIQFWGQSQGFQGNFGFSPMLLQNLPKLLDLGKSPKWNSLPQSFGKFWGLRLISSKFTIAAFPKWTRFSQKLAAWVVTLRKPIHITW